MQSPRQQLREVLAGDVCVPVAPIFDPLSARIAETVGWRLCKLTGSTAKAASLGVPDQLPLAIPNDLADLCARINRVADVGVIVDADDGGGNALAVRRNVRELEAAGAAAIELEDCRIPPTLAANANPAALMVTRDEHVGKLEAALAARRDSTTVIVARTRALELLPRDDALDRIAAYCRTGADALYLSGHLDRRQIEAAHEAAGLPMYLLRLPADAAADAAFLAANQIVLRTVEQAIYGMAVKAIHESLQHLLAGGTAAELADQRASGTLLQAITGTAELRDWEHRYADTVTG